MGEKKPRKLKGDRIVTSFQSLRSLKVESSRGFEGLSNIRKAAFAKPRGSVLGRALGNPMLASESSPTQCP